MWILENLVVLAVGMGRLRGSRLNETSPPCPRLRERGDRPLCSRLTKTTGAEMRALVLVEPIATRQSGMRS